MPALASANSYHAESSSASQFSRDGGVGFVGADLGDGPHDVLLEREDVLLALSDHLVEARRGRGRLVLLRGEAGVGKSAVLTRFNRSSGRTGALWGWCDPMSTPRPLGPWLDIVPGLGALDTALRGEPGADDVSGMLRLVTGFIDSGELTVLFLEDLHWADQATLDLLCLLARRIDQRRVLLVASYRDDEIGPSHPAQRMLGYLAGVPAVHRLGIEPLSEQGVTSLAAGHRVDPGELYRLTGGNPFFVTEVLAGGGIGVPATVSDAVTARLARLSAAGRRIAQTVAVIGSTAATPLVEHLAGASASDVIELVDAGFLRAMGSGVGFRHELARIATLDAMAAADRAALHACVLDRLVADPAHRDDSAVLAHHAEAAGDAEAVLIHAPVAAADAAGSGAYREAASQFGRALRCGAALAPERRAILLEGFAQASAMVGEVLNGLSALQEAIELRAELGDRLREGDDLRWLSWLLWPAGRCAAARRTGHRAVQVLEACPPSGELARALVNICQLAAYDQHGVAIAEEYARRAIELGEKLAIPEVVCQARFHLALTRVVCGEAGSTADGDGDGWTDMEAARDEALRAGLPEAASFMAMLMALSAAAQRDIRRAVSAGAVLESLASDREILNYLLIGRSQRPLSLLHAGAWDEAVEQANVLLETSGPPVARVMPLVAVSLARARRGEPQAEEPLDEAAQLFEPTGWALIVSAARAECAWLAGDLDRARDEAQRGLAAAVPSTDPWITGELARWLWMSGGRAAPARAAAPFALELAGNWAGAARIWEDRGCLYDAALARLAGDVPALFASLQTFEALGSRPAAAIAGARLRAQGARLGTRGPRRGTRTNPHGLTTRQLEILDLVRQELSGPQIATRLHLSPKTVDHHVSAALAKLGVHSRADAVRVLFGGPR